jgi:hypothetical protein
MNKTIGLIVIMCSLLAVSCSKKVVTPITISKPTPTLSIEEIDFEYLQGKARMVLRDANKERDVKANIRVRKDSVIWMTFSVIGVQGGKALIDKEFYVFEYAELSQRYNFNIDFNVIQSAMLGNLIESRTDQDQIVQENSFFMLTQNAGTISVSNYINSASMKIEKVEMKETNTNNSLVLNYSNFQPLDNKLFPYNGTISLFYKTLAGILNTTVIFEYNKIEVGDKELKFPFNIPKRYVRR